MILNDNGGKIIIIAMPNFICLPFHSNQKYQFDISKERLSLRIVPGNIVRALTCVSPGREAVVSGGSLFGCKVTTGNVVLSTSDLLYFNHVTSTPFGLTETECVYMLIPTRRQSYHNSVSRPSRIAMSTKY